MEYKEYKKVKLQYINAQLAKNKVSNTKSKGTPFGVPLLLEVPARFELADQSFADLNSHSDFT